ncbi:hypothetical protein M0R45_033767 [Rubus argutus]|uniref:Uncharacterized protein n=1 Tax=Rubus argutus TaxID=59490 RepID=A0AAW1WMS1_RUBAR
MAEPQRGNSSSADSKKKSSFLALIQGPKARRKCFDFEKLDMEFNLDGHFNKISSFKMVMSDFDFSSPTKKDAKTKEERSEEEPSRGSRQGNQDHFQLSFDFNELDNFDLDSTVTTRGKSSKKNQDSSKEVVSDTAGCQGSKVDLAEGTVHSMKEGWLHQIAKVNAISSGKDVNDKMLIEDGPDHEDLPFQNSSPLDIGCSGSNNGDRTMSDSAILTENHEAAKGDLHIGEASATLVLCKTPHDIKSITGNQNSTLKLPLFTQTSESTVDKVTLRNQSKAGEFHSKISKRLEDTGPQLVGVNAYDAQHGSKLLIAPVVIDKETKVSPVIPGREGSDSHGVPNGTKLVGNSQLCDKEVTEREPVVRSEQINFFKDLSIQESPSSSTEKPRMPRSQRVYPKLMLLSAEPMRNSKIITAGGNRLCPDKQPAQKKTDISTWKISKNIGGNKSSLNAAPQKQVLASLNPLKRLSLSPRKTRNFKEPSKGAVEEQVGMHENHLESKTKNRTSRLGSPCMVNVMELEIPSAMETGENVEKAEAYTKELEDICNILKKKHEEAKEILNIHEVQKFAAKLASKELQAC